MGLIQSIFCSITFCLERVLTWTCCAFLLMLLMFTILLLMVYGISVGYHYAQKELASFALRSRSTTEDPFTGRKVRRSGEVSDEFANQPVVRLVAVNRSDVETPPQPAIEIYSKRPEENVYIDRAMTPVVILETERPPQEPALSPHERDLARKLIGRFRRSKNNTVVQQSPETPFLRPLKESTNLTRFFT